MSIYAWVFRMKLSDDKNRMEHEMREQIHRVMEQSRLQEVANEELMATEEAWIRKVGDGVFYDSTGSNHINKTSRLNTSLFNYCGCVPPVYIYHQ